MVPILINKDVFKPSYSDLKFKVQNLLCLYQPNKTFTGSGDWGWTPFEEGIMLSIVCPQASKDSCLSHIQHIFILFQDFQSFSYSSNQRAKSPLGLAQKSQISSFK